MPQFLAYVLLFTFVAAFFIFIHLVIGKLVRPNRPDAEKKTVYECGEPTIGSAWVQFDLRFYVVALLFVIFDVEMAFFFPWAVVFGKANQLAGERITAEQRIALNHELSSGMREKARQQAAVDLHNANKAEENRSVASSLGWIAFGDILVFFGVLLVGFAYLWRRGDLDWVRSIAAQRLAGEELANSRSSSEVGQVAV
jgi:NADH-quinone oxidoreductase subunit A